jgi:hypothetical protein
MPSGGERAAAPGGAEERSAAEKDELSLLELLVPRAQGRIDGQLRESDALDGKALGVLGADAAAIALLVAVRFELSRVWWLAAAALGASAVALLATVWPRAFDVGPDPRRFYETMAGSTPVQSARQMLSELIAASEHNAGQLPRKRRLFKAGFALLVAGLLAALIVALVS